MSSSVTGSNGVFTVLNQSGAPMRTGPANGNLTGGGFIEPPKFNRQAPTPAAFAQQRAADAADGRRRKEPR